LRCPLVKSDFGGARGFRLLRGLSADLRTFVFAVRQMFEPVQNRTLGPSAGY